MSPGPDAGRSQPQIPVTQADGVGARWYSSPEAFYPVAGRLVRWCALAAAALVALGLYIGFFVTPTHARHGESYRIIFIHQPASWMSVLVYMAMAGCGALGLARDIRLATMAARALAPTGALFTGVSLWTGILWGQPASGAWWDWDARLTTELLLLFMYLGVMSLHGVIEDWRRADRSAALLALTGAVNIPIVFISIDWWNALHRAAAPIRAAQPETANVMTAGMVAMGLGFAAYAISASMSRMRSIILEREHQGTLATMPGGQ